jgi:hypothetical protein
MPPTAYANGAIGHPGIAGTDLIVEATAPFAKFIVDEEVILDFRTFRAKVTYVVSNQSSSTINLTMLFPVEGVDCQEAENLYKTVWEKRIDFKARLNDIELQVKQTSKSELRLSTEYEKIKETACALFAFKAKITPGKNTLSLSYNLEPSIFVGDMVGSGRTYTYSIWPAKNWVPKFRKALWRVILPEMIFLDTRYKRHFGDWYTQVSQEEESLSLSHWYKGSIKIDAPGSRHDFTDHVDFVANDYVPSGSISVKYDVHEILFLVKKDCKETTKTECWRSVFKIHPYTGNKRCYDADDLQIKPAYMGFNFSRETMPFLRNEIFARKGYVFKTEEMKDFFSKMSWYNPRKEEVQLNKIEEWNVNFILEVEKEIKSDSELEQDSYKLDHIYERMKATCPPISAEQTNIEK